MQFLDAVRDPSYGAEPRMFQLHFYYWRENGEIGEAKTAYRLGPELFGFENRKKHADACIYALFRKLGIEETGKDSFLDKEGLPPPDELREDLYEFLKHGISAATQLRTIYLDLKEELENLLARVRDILQVPIHVSTWVEMGEAVSCLKRILRYTSDFRGVDLEGLRVRIDRRYFFSDDGVISIPFDFKKDDCIRTLNENAVHAKKTCRDSEATPERIRETIRELKKNFGLQSLYVLTECNDVEGLRGLNLLNRHGERLRGHNLRDHSIAIGKGLRISNYGCVIVPFDFDWTNLDAFLRANLKTAKAIRKAYEGLKQEISQREKRLKKKLGLYLTQNICIAEREYLDCLHKLIGISRNLSFFDLKGRHVSVGLKYGVENDGRLRIPHDFQIRDLRDFMLERHGQIPRELQCRCFS